MIVGEFSEWRRKLVLDLAGGYPPAFRCIHMMEKNLQRDQIYSWLIRNEITGRKLVEFFIERKGSYVLVIQDVLKMMGQKVSVREVLGIKQ